MLWVRATDLCDTYLMMGVLNCYFRQIRAIKITVATKDEEIVDLKAHISSHVEQEARLGAQITTLRERVLELVSFLNSYNCFIAKPATMSPYLEIYVVRTITHSVVYTFLCYITEE